MCESTYLFPNLVTSVKIIERKVGQNFPKSQFFEKMRKAIWSYSDSFHDSNWIPVPEENSRILENERKKWKKINADHTVETPFVVKWDLINWSGKFVEHTGSYSQLRFKSQSIDGQYCYFEWEQLLTANNNKPGKYDMRINIPLRYGLEEEEEHDYFHNDKEGILDRISKIVENEFDEGDGWWAEPSNFLAVEE